MIIKLLLWKKTQISESPIPYDALLPIMTPRLKKAEVKRVMKTYLEIREDVEERCQDFKRVWSGGSDETIYKELVFCLLTPQSKARSCWTAVERLEEKGLLFRGSKTQISKALTGVRFHNNKAGNLVEARKRFCKGGRPRIRECLSTFGDAREAREWLVFSIKGLGFKEASHFLRNIGLGGDLAILDRHILKNLVVIGALEEVPSSMSKHRYLEIENEMIRAAKKMDIPLAHLDLVLWYKEAGEVFK